jgi:hypothetical protein
MAEKSGGTVTRKQKRINHGQWVRTLAEQVCKDCGAYGCLIPVPHTVSDGREAVEAK